MPVSLFMFIPKKTAKVLFQTRPRLMDNTSKFYLKRSILVLKSFYKALCGFSGRADIRSRLLNRLDMVL